MILYHIIAMVISFCVCECELQGSIKYVRTCAHYNPLVFSHIVLYCICIQSLLKNSILQWLELKKAEYKCPCCRNDMLTDDELLEAATVIVDSSDAGNGNNTSVSSLLQPSPRQRSRIYYHRRRRQYAMARTAMSIPDL